MGARQTIELPLPDGGMIRLGDANVRAVSIDSNFDGGLVSLRFDVEATGYRHYPDAEDALLTDSMTAELESVRAELAEALDRIVELEAELAAVVG